MRNDNINADEALFRLRRYMEKHPNCDWEDAGLRITMAQILQEAVVIGTPVLELQLRRAVAQLSASLQTAKSARVTTARRILIDMLPDAPDHDAIPTTETPHA